MTQVVLQEDRRQISLGGGVNYAYAFPATCRPSQTDASSITDLVSPFANVPSESIASPVGPYILRQESARSRLRSWGNHYRSRVSQRDVRSGVRARGERRPRARTASPRTWVTCST